MRGQIFKLGSLAATILVAACSSDQGYTEVEMSASVAELTRSNVMNVTGAPEREGVRVGEVSTDNVRRLIVSDSSFSAAIARFRSAQAEVGVATSGSRPQVTGSLTAGGIIEGADNRLGAAANLNLVQMVFDGGETAALVDAASARAFAAKAQVAVVGNEVGREALAAWSDVWLYNARIDLLRSRVAELEPWVDRIEQLIASGVANRSVLNAAERQIIDIKLEEESLQASLLAAQERFRKYFGFKPGRVPAPPAVFSEGELLQLRSTWQDAPALIAAAAELVATESDVAASEARMKPRVMLSTGLNSPISRNDEEYITAGIVVEHSFFDGGRRRSQSDAVRERLQSLRGDFEDTKSTGQADLEAGLAQYKSIGSSLNLLNKQIQVSREEADSIRNQLGSGQSNLQQFVEAEIRNYQAQARRLQLLAEQRKIEASLGELTGKLLPQLRVNIEDFL